MIEATLEDSKCAQSYDWLDRDPMDEACKECGESGSTGWQCAGGSHWICRGCVISIAKKCKATGRDFSKC